MNSTFTNADAVKQSFNIIGENINSLQAEVNSYLAFMQSKVEEVRGGDISFNVCVDLAAQQAHAMQQVVAAQEDVIATLDKYLENQQAADDDVMADARAIMDI